MSRMPFWRFSRSTLIISVNSIDWLVFVVKTEFSVRHELTFYIYIIWANKNLYHCKFVVDKLAVGQVSVRALRFSPISTIPPTSILIFILILLIRKKEELSPRTLKRSITLSSIWSQWKKKLLPLFFIHPLKGKRVKLENLPTKVVLWCKSESNKKENYFQSLKGWYFCLF